MVNNFINRRGEPRVQVIYRKKKRTYTKILFSTKETQSLRKGKKRTKRLLKEITSSTVGLNAHQSKDEAS